MIRRAVKNDIDIIMNMLPEIKKGMTESGNTQWDENYPLRSDIENDVNAGSLYVYIDEEGLEGFICINLTQPEQYKALKWAADAPAMVMHRMAVKPSARHKGIAKQFMAYAEELAEAYSIHFIRTDTCADNTKMQQLFGKAGYVLRGDIRYTGRNEIYLCYDKALKA